MSIPAFGWALERGAALKLLASDRLVLVYLADLANGGKVCWPSQERIVEYTGLTLRTVRNSIHRLDKAQLIRVEASPGKLPHYHILRDTPANGNGVTPANQHKVTPANGNGVGHHTPANQHPLPRQMVQLTPAKDAQTPANEHPDPLIPKKEEPKTRAPAREGEDLKSRNGMGTPPSAGEQTTTPACGHDTASAEPPIADEQMAAKLAALAAGVGRSFQTNYPPRSSSLTRNEQHDLVSKPPPWQAKPIPSDQLAAMRRLAQLGRPVHVDA